MIKAQIAAIWHNRQLQKDTFLLTVSEAVSVAIGMVSMPILTSLLSRESYGALNFASSVQGLIRAFSAPGVENGIGYSVARGYEGTFRVGTYYRFRIYLRNSLFVLPVAAWFFLFKHDHLVAWLIVVSGITLPWAYAFATWEQFLVGRRDFIAIFWRRLGARAISAFAPIAAAYLNPTAIMVMAGRELASAGVCIGIFMVLVRKTHNDLIDPEFALKCKGFGQVSVVHALANLIDRLVLGTLGAFSPLAAYSIGLTMATPLDVIGINFNKVAFARMSRPRDIKVRKFWLVLSVVMALGGIVVFIIIWHYIWPFVHRFFPAYPDLGQIVPPLFAASCMGWGSALGQNYGQFHDYELWKRYYLARNGSRIIISAAAVMLGGLWGAIYTKMGYAFLDLLFFNYLFIRDKSKENSFNNNG